jgi:signal peptidase I
VAHRFGSNPSIPTSHLPRLPGVPDGTYEILDGKVYELPFTWLPIFGGYAKEVSVNHPLYNQSPERIAQLFNLGIELLNYYLPAARTQLAVPSRYAYFRNENLYLLGAPILKKSDPALAEFKKQELQKQTVASSYQPFIDNGPPSLDEIRKNGIRVPEKMYLALGDNHAMSADSRQFGFVPEDNLKGSVSFLFSPPSERLGTMAQPAQRHFTFPNLFIWSSFILIMIGSSLYYRRKMMTKEQ